MGRPPSIGGAAPGGVQGPSGFPIPEPRFEYSQGLLFSMSYGDSLARPRSRLYRRSRPLDGNIWVHVLGLDFEDLTYRSNGRDMRLADVHGKVIEEVLA